LILIEKDYNYAIDIWASGVILAELFAMHNKAPKQDDSSKRK